MRRGDHVKRNRAAARERCRYGAAHLAAQAVCRRSLAAIVLAGAALMLNPANGFAHVPQVVAFGDSLTAGLGLPANEAFPARLEARLHAQGIDVHIVNAGVSGDTTADGLARIDWSLSDKPDCVMLALGANDAMRGIPPWVVHANLDQMLTKIQATGAKVLMLGMLAPSNWGPEYKRAFDQVFPTLAQAHHVALFPFFLEGVAMNPQLNQADGIHPNEHGVAIMVDHVAPLLAKLIGASS